MNPPSDDPARQNSEGGLCDRTRVRKTVASIIRHDGRFVIVNLLSVALFSFYPPGYSLAGPSLAWILLGRDYIF